MNNGPAREGGVYGLDPMLTAPMLTDPGRSAFRPKNRNAAGFGAYALRPRAYPQTD